MTNHTPPSSTAFPNAITEDDIADYLGNTPDFFQRHAQLLASVFLTSPHNGRSVSLQERQAEMLREKIKVLESRMMEMIRNGNENVILADKLLRWTRTLFLSQDPALLPEQIAADIADEFLVPQVGIKVWGVAPAFAHCAFAQGVSEDAKLFVSSLSEPFCGINTGFEALSWLPDPAGVSSLALLPLRMGPAGNTGPAFGLLVLASPDAQRFHSGMGTEFLQRLGELAGAALSRLKA